MILYDLPVGTRFHVLNGSWEGLVVREGADKYVVVEGSNEKRKIIPNEDYKLDICVIDGKEGNDVLDRIKHILDVYDLDVNISVEELINHIK